MLLKNIENLRDAGMHNTEEFVCLGTISPDHFEISSRQSSNNAGFWAHIGVVIKFLCDWCAISF